MRLTFIYQFIKDNLFSFRISHILTMDFHDFNKENKIVKHERPASGIINKNLMEVH